VLSSLFFIYRISQLTRVEPVAPAALAQALPDGVEAYRIFGSLFFAAVSKLEALMEPGHFGQATAPRVLVLDLVQLISLDTTGLETLDALRRQLARTGGALILAGPNEQPLSLMTRSGFLDRVGRDNVVATLPQAVARARAVAAAAAASRAPA